MGNKLPKWGRPQRTLEQGHYHTVPAGFSIQNTATTCAVTNYPVSTVFTAAMSVYQDIPKKDCSICNPKPKEWTMLEWAQKQAEALFWRNPIDSSIESWIMHRSEMDSYLLDSYLLGSIHV